MTTAERPGRLDMNRRVETVMIAYDDEPVALPLDKEVTRFLWSLLVFVGALLAGSCLLSAGCGC